MSIGRNQKLLGNTSFRMIIMNRTTQSPSKTNDFLSSLEAGRWQLLSTIHSEILLGGLCQAADVWWWGLHDYLFSLVKPTCKTNAVMIVGAAVNEPTRITCEVDAFPKPKQDEWQWTVNNSVGTVEVMAVSILLVNYKTFAIFYYFLDHRL